MGTHTHTNTKNAVLMQLERAFYYSDIIEVPRRLSYEGGPKSHVTSEVKRKPVNIHPPNFYKSSDYIPPLTTQMSSRLSHIWSIVSIHRSGYSVEL